MSTRLYTTQYTIPAMTAVAAAIVTPVVLEDNNLDAVDIIIPDGHIGLTGIAIRSANAPVVPFALGTWINGNNEVLRFPYDDEITENGLQVVAYNTDQYAHTFYLRWQISDLTVQSPVQIISPQNPATAAPADLAATLSLAGVGA